ncbi:histone-like nucleoid-structuring protein Lsr2 [Streptoalloteichus hindustanus]|uniref:histone-like nucleoid-structuring protein Lsr2 n=1 Tax=Streptoalloteichus hindustanus TaxID=2017 RepID=UPI000936DC29|nr:Lsr2 family protein [Streptoalloteichus hindustanus]
MAQKVIVTLVDDLDGTTGGDINTVQFGLDGLVYAIDLTDENAAKLRDILTPYIAAARRAQGRAKNRTAATRTATPATSATPATPVASASAATDREESRAIRAWAVATGHPVADRGRIPADVIAAYHQARTKPRIQAALFSD